MFDNEQKVFRCNRCNKKIETAENCWTKWQFPPKANSFQDKSIKALEFQDAPILCLKCADEIMTETF